jgi:hypothetical protein
MTNSLIPTRLCQRPVGGRQELPATDSLPAWLVTFLAMDRELARNGSSRTPRARDRAVPAGMS